MNFLIGVLHEETVLDTISKLFLALFDDQKSKNFLDVCAKHFLCTDFSKNHLECILKKFFEAFDLFQKLFLGEDYEKSQEYTFEKKSLKSFDYF